MGYGDVYRINSRKYVARSPETGAFVLEKRLVYGMVYNHMSTEGPVQRLDQSQSQLQLPLLNLEEIDRNQKLRNILVYTIRTQLSEHLPGVLEQARAQQTKSKTVAVDAFAFSGRSIEKALFTELMFSSGDTFESVMESGITPQEIFDIVDSRMQHITQSVLHGRNPKMIDEVHETESRFIQIYEEQSQRDWTAEEHRAYANSLECRPIRSQNDIDAYKHLYWLHRITGETARAVFLTNALVQDEYTELELRMLQKLQKPSEQFLCDCEVQSGEIPELHRLIANMKEYENLTEAAQQDFPEDMLDAKLYVDPVTKEPRAAVSHRVAPRKRKPNTHYDNEVQQFIADIQSGSIYIEENKRDGILRALESNAVIDLTMIMSTQELAAYRAMAESVVDAVQLKPDIQIFSTFARKNLRLVLEGALLPAKPWDIFPNNPSAKFLEKEGYSVAGRTRLQQLPADLTLPPFKSFFMSDAPSGEVALGSEWTRLTAGRQEHVSKTAHNWQIGGLKRR